MASTTARVGLVTNAAGFAGPPAVDALLANGFLVFAHDRAFADDGVWRRFADDRSGLRRISAHDPAEIIARLGDEAPALHALVSNDHVPAPSHPLESAPMAGLHDNLDALVRFPFALVQAALPVMKRQDAANIVMITSNRTRLPLPGGAFPDAARAAANAMVRSLAIECAKHGVMVNAVAPNFLYSEAYYPKAVFEETAAGRAHIAESVPLGRLAEPREIGELILFLATVKTRFLTGAIVDFSGGWPFGPPRPEQPARD